MADQLTEVERLRAENARLRALLEAQGVDASAPHTETAEPLSLTLTEKVSLFRSLFRGRTDAYPIRWESKSGRSGYSPACANEWRPGICEKPRIKCSDCRYRLLIPLSDQVIYGHLSGRHTIGIYPLLVDDTCYFLAVDFDEEGWREDAVAFVQSCRELDVPAALEISRSGSGAHVWIFFMEAVPARDARRLGTAIISHTCTRTRQLQLSSYDRLFPNQDTLPKGGYGNLIALPLQRRPREEGRSVFVDGQLQPHSDQWGHLASIKPIAAAELEPMILRASAGAHPLDVTFASPDEDDKPWVHRTSPSGRLPQPMPSRLDAVVANMIYFDKAQLPQPLANRLIRLAAFQNPEFYRAQAMRFPVWDKPRVIGCAENFQNHIALPRGCQDAVDRLLGENGIQCHWHEEQYVGVRLQAEFVGSLRPDQQTAVVKILQHDVGVFCAPTAFGKTVIAAAVLARRATNTLVLVHRAELLKQWRERLQSLLAAEEGTIGFIGGGKSKPTGKIDIAVMQSLSRQGEIKELVENYGHVIIDECHHVSAYSFESILKRVRAKYVLGLTATPIRRDGQHPIIFMQCGPVRYTATAAEGMPDDLAVIPKLVSTTAVLAPDAPIQDVFVALASDAERTSLIATEVVASYESGRKVLVLTERTDHIDLIRAALPRHVAAVFVLHGRMPKKKRAGVIDELNAIPADAPRVLIATGKLLGEGFDHAALDTLVLAMPISWRGTLQQYAGRLHREHATKTNVRIIDFVDVAHPALARMWQKRQRGYRAMGYRIESM